MNYTTISDSPLALDLYNDTMIYQKSTLYHRLIPGVLEGAMSRGTR